MKQKQTLLDKAREIALYKYRPHIAGDEEIELLIAYVNGEVGIAQAQRAMGFKYAGSATNYLISIMRRAARNGQIKIERV